MKILMRIENSSFIISAEGAFSDGDCRTLQEALEQSTGSFCRRVLVDLKNLQNITPTGQRILLTFLTRLRAQRMPLILCHVNQSVQAALSSSGLDKVIAISPTIQEAQALPL